MIGMIQSRKLTLGLLVAITGGFASTASADREFDQDITAIFGSGNGDTSWTTNDNVATTGIELGLRAKVRYAYAGNPQGTKNSNGDGTYSFIAGDKDGPSGTSGRGYWSYEWSINTDATDTTGLKTTDLTYSLRMYSTTAAYMPAFDPIAKGGDHAFGDNSTLNGAGDEATDMSSYIVLSTNNNIAQNSWQPQWEGAVGFDPTLDGVYTYMLTASDSNGVLASTYIKVVVGDAVVVPTPGAALAAIPMLGALVLRRRRRN